jgi:predicted alpha/beta-fold hydrolase
MLENYTPPLWLPDGHTQSIYPSLFRKVTLSESPRRERVTTPDQDFLDIDWYGGELSERPLLIVSHGLEGSSDRQYVTGLIHKMKGMNALAWNYRSCSGEPNKNLRFYHSGATDDLDFIIKLAIERGAKDIYLAGFSLGGNLTLKWLGEQGKNPPQMIRKAVAFSVPLHLSSSSKQLAKRENRLYTHRFLQTLIKKVKEKSARYPQDITVEMIDSIKSLVDFDDVITGPLHGFKDGEDYYEKSSSLYFLDQINVPTLIVNAKNDPFLSAECIPESYVKTLGFVQLDAQEKGGHCGFYPKNYQGYTWSENRAEHWFKNSV